MIRSTFLAFIVLNLAPALAAESHLIQRMPSGTVDWTQRWVEATGSGVAKTTGNQAQERLLGERAALSDAYRQLAETVHGVHVDSETTVRDFVTESDVIRTRVEGVIKGAKATGPAQKNTDGTYHITLRMPLYGSTQLSGAVQLDQRIRRRHSSTSSRVSLNKVLTPARSIPGFPLRLASRTLAFSNLQLAQHSRYTGLVIDMCTLPIQPVMSPAVLSDAQQVYIGNFPIDPDQVIAEGVLQYYDDFDAAVSSARVGDHPLIIEAIGTNTRQSDIYVSPEDAQRIAAADADSGFLKALKVVVSAL